eukprot:TRINITY_DN275_c0_g1_i4.p2 TRINITY_DN275_c0_g1~~TRINITY_DN275_c0_g1_i4.p2  ORF type:complete len:237 (+),score=48.04 TRINITY_DN275_c0_g1_i4:47-712(+)
MCIRDRYQRRVHGILKMESEYEKLALDIFDELNLARQVPNALVAGMTEKLEFFEENVMTVPGYDMPIETYEGAKAYNDAIDFLRKQESLPVLVYSKEIEKAAMMHAADIGEAGQSGHIGGNGQTPTQRVAKQVKWTRMVAETVELGGKDAGDIIAALIADDGNEERSNRKVIFSKNVRYVGIGVAPHKLYGTVTVIDFVGGVHESEFKTPGADASPSKESA